MFSWGFPCFRWLAWRRVKFSADDCLQLSNSHLVMRQMLASHRFDIAQVALRANPIEERRFSRLITQLCRLKCLLRLWHELVAEQLDVMMKRLDLCQLIPQQPQCFLLSALKSLLGSCKTRARLPHAGGIF